MSDVSDWVKTIPPFTRYWLGLSLGVSILARLQIIDYLNLLLLYSEIIYRFQIWRPLTALFFYPINPGTGIHFLINCYFIYTYAARLETGQYVGRPADYLFMLLFNWVSCVVISLIADILILMDSMVMSVLYIWCQLNKDVIVSFWFGSRFKAMYLPFVLLAFNMIISGGGMRELIGIIVGHVYFFLMFKYPQELGGQQFISTPSILYEWFPNERLAGGFGPAPFRRQDGGDPVAPRGGPRGHQWGRGFALGND